MTNKKRKHFQTLTRPQLIALATQKKVLPYQDALAKTKVELIALMVDIEGVLTPVKTWDLDKDAQQVTEELGTVEVS